MTDEHRDQGSAQSVVYLVPRSDPRGSRSEDLIDLLDVWRRIWSARQMIAVLSLLFAAIGFAYAYTATEWYQADVVLVAAAKRSVPSGLSQLGALASLTGMDLPSGQGGEPIAILRSREFARDFIDSQNLLSVLLPADADSVSSRLGLEKAGRPDIRDAVKYFDEQVRTVSEDKRTGLVILSIRWTNGETAAKWANLLVSRLNERLRDQAIREARSASGVLQQELAATPVVTVQQSIGRVLEGELQKMSLAGANEEFAFKVIDPAVPPKYRVSPKRRFVTILSGLIGCSFGMAIAIISTRRRSANSSKFPDAGAAE